MRCSVCGGPGTLCPSVDDLGHPHADWYCIICYAQKGVYGSESLNHRGSSGSGKVSAGTKRSVRQVRGQSGKIRKPTGKGVRKLHTG